MAWATGHCVLLRHLVIMKIKEHNMCRLCGEGQETPLHLLNECPATQSLRVAWETLLRNPDHAKCSPILSMAERLLFFAKEPKIKQLMTRDNEQAVLMLAHPRRHPNDREAGSPQNPGDQSIEYQAQPGANYTLSSPSMVSSEED